MAGTGARTPYLCGRIGRLIASADPLTVALRAADEATALVRDRRGQAGQVRSKQNRTDLVSETDLASERTIVAVIRSHFPNHSIIAEEGGGGIGDADHCWLVDPLDGTTNFVQGHPIFAVSIAYVAFGQLAAAVVSAPALNERYLAELGAGASLNDHPIRVSETDVLADAALASGFAYGLDERLANLPLWSTFIAESKAVRRDGSAALDLAFVAAGRFDGYWERPLGPWDCAAGLLLVTEAGGTISSFSGERISLDRPEVVASNGRIHDEMLAVIARTASAG